jgi:hypothetical protein
MKKKMKQFLAAMMAVAMVLSLCVTAGAGSVNSADTVTGAAFDNLSSGGKVTDLGTSGGVKANSTSEGRLPEDPVEVIFPTIPAKMIRNDGVSSKSGEEFSVFDIILDPHQLISVTSGARYYKEGITKNFADSRLYFLQSFSADGKTQNYANESYPLQITNKGLKAVAVDLSVDFTYPDDVITLVGEDGVTNTSGDTTSDNGAEMSFALKVGTVASGDTTVSGDTYYVMDPSKVDAGEEVDHTPYVTVSGKGDYLSAATLGDDGLAGVGFTWLVSGDKITTEEAKLKDVKVTLSYVKPTSVLSGGVLQTGEIQVAVAKPSGYANSVISGGTVSGDKVTGEGEVTITLNNNTEDVATITLSVVDPNPRTMKVATKSGENFDQVIQFKKHDTGVVVHTAIAGVGEDGYTKQWTDPEGNDVPQEITETGYYWKLDTSITEFPTVFFSLVGDINNDDMWDTLGTDSTGISFELIWDVMQRSTYYENVETVTTTAVPADGSGGAATPAGPQGELPTLEVTKKASGTSGTAKNATITWTPGTGDYANFVPSTTIVLSNGNTLGSVTRNDDAHTLTSTAAGSIGSGTTGTVVFEAPAGSGWDNVEIETTALR